MTHYAIIGGGRLARHMHHYFSLLGHPCSAWARDLDCDINTRSERDATQRLNQVIKPATHILLAVTDMGIRPVLKQFPQLHEKTLVHCSGARSFPGVAGAHPLMTFGGELYPLERYRSIPFIIENGSEFARILPGLPNPHFSISITDKARYHALCVMAGNFAQLLWSAAAGRLETMGLPDSILEPYLQQVTSNFVDDGASALTGPLTRGDQHTLDRNLSALHGDPLEQLYRSFVELHRTQKQTDWPLEAVQ